MEPDVDTNAAALTGMLVLDVSTTVVTQSRHLRGTSAARVAIGFGFHDQGVCGRRRQTRTVHQGFAQPRPISSSTMGQTGHAQGGKRDPPRGVVAETSSRTGAMSGPNPMLTNWASQVRTPVLVLGDGDVEAELTPAPGADGGHCEPDHQARDAKPCPVTSRGSRGRCGPVGARHPIYPGACARWRRGGLLVVGWRGAGHVVTGCTWPGSTRRGRWWVARSRPSRRAPRRAGHETAHLSDARPWQ